MRKNMRSLSSIEAVREMKLEIANELGISDSDGIYQDQNDLKLQEANRRLAERMRYSLIGFK